MLESLQLQDLRSFSRLPESIGHLQALTVILVRCGWLRTARDTAFNWGPRCLETLTLDLRDGNQSPYTRSLGMYEGKCSADLSYFPKQVKSMRTVEVLEAAAVHEKFPRLKCLALTLVMQDLELFVDVGRHLAHLECLKIADRGGRCRLTKLPECCGQFGSLKVLKILGCRALVHLPESLGQLSALEQLEIEECDALFALPESCGQLGSLKLLIIRRCDTLVDLPEWVGQLPALEHLEIFNCEKLTRLKRSVGQVRPLERLTISPSDGKDSEQILNSLSGSLKRLTILDYDNELQLPASLSQLLLLEHLDLVSCPFLEAPPQSIGQIHGLRCLEIKDCRDWEELLESIGQLGLLKRVAIKSRDQMGNLGNCVRWLGALEELEVNRSTLAKLAGHLGQLGSLKRLAVESLAFDYEGELPESLGQLSALEELAIRNKDKQESNWPPYDKRSPYLKRVIRKLPESIGKLLALKRLEISNFEEIMQLPATVGYLSRLCKVIVRHCPKLEAWRPSSQHLQHVRELELTYEDPDGHAPKFTYFDKESSYYDIYDDEENSAAEAISDDGEILDETDEEIPDDEEILDDEKIADDEVIPDDKEIADYEVIPDDKEIADYEVTPDDEEVVDDEVIPDDKEIADDKEIVDDKEIADDEVIPDDEEIADDNVIPDDEESSDDGDIPDDGHLRNKIFTTILTRQDLLAMVGEGRSLLEAAVIIERAKNS